MDLTDHEQEEPQFSSAASCIRLSHLGRTFGPVYTHQSFDDERIRGHQPFDDAIAQTTRAAEKLKRQRSTLSTQQPDDGAISSSSLPHKSFEHHEQATHRIALSILLAPSCRTCAMTIETEPKKRPRTLSMSSVVASDLSMSDSDGSSRPVSPYAHRPAKRRCSGRRGESDEENEPSLSSDAKSAGRTNATSILERLESLGGSSSAANRFEDPSSFGATAPTTMVFHPLPSGRTRRRRMDVDEVMNRAGRALPPVIHCDHRADSLGGVEAEDCAASASLVQVATSDEVQNDYLNEPIGTVLYEYQRPIKDVSTGATIEMGDFVLCLADGKNVEVAEYHNRVQGIALWFIENASNVDLSCNKDGGYWKVLYVFRKHDVGKLDRDENSGQPIAAAGTSRQSPSSPLMKRAVDSLYSTCLSLFSRRLSPREDSNEANTTEQMQPSTDMPRETQQSSFQYSLVGYMTLYHFFSQYKKPKAGTIMRMCQVVVLPTYQRAGHGKVMMYGVHEIAGGKYDDVLPSSAEHRGGIVEVDVEDPAIEFTALRDRVDYEVVRDIIASDPESLLGTNIIGPISQQDYYLPLSDKDAIIAGAGARISPAQIQIALELYKREMLDEEIERRMEDRKKKLAVRRKGVAKLEAMYDSMVKKRLYKLHRENISGCPGKNEKGAMLDYLYNDTLQHYRSVLASRRVRT